MKSIISNEKRCFLCGTTQNLEEHHIFAGGLRKQSEKYGCKVFLCHEHHWQVHNGNMQLYTYLCKIAQKRFEEEYPYLSFMAIFHRNWL